MTSWQYNAWHAYLAERKKNLIQKLDDVSMNSINMWVFSGKITEPLEHFTTYRN
jgi:hypothetical protein